MSHETSKAVRRRFLEDQDKGYPFWNKVFQGTGLDVGCGDDPLPYLGCKLFDKEDGDANKLSEYFELNTFNYIHASQLVEHLHDPVKSLKDWHKILKKHGYVIITVPSWELYEGMVWPSRWNPDHKSTWSLWLKSSPAPVHICVPNFLQNLAPEYVWLRADLIDTNYNYKIGNQRDQTQNEELGVECFIEMVLKKR